MYFRKDLEKLERAQLKPYACFSGDASRSGVKKHPTRTEFQRDRDRILHSKAFRRLEYKTQLFLTDKGDHLRTRLTHSLEVSQLSRSMAIQLGLNQDLVEAIALGHDLGHTPFGHAGERELIRLLALENIRCFKHNTQSVRIVELLEKKYPYDGLRLTLATKEGILKHTGLPEDIPDYCKDLYPEKPFSVTLEGQIVAIADEIAQITHDLDDYLRYNILEFSKILDHEIFEEVRRFNIDEYGEDLSKVINLKGNKDSGRLKDTIIRYLVDFLVTMLVRQSDELLKGDSNIKAFELNKVYITYHGRLHDIVTDFKKYLEKIIYSDYRIKEMDYRGTNIVNKLFNLFKEKPDLMPETTYEKYLTVNKDERLLVITDYISGMTDRYAFDTYNSVYGLPDNNR